MHCGLIAVRARYRRCSTAAPSLSLSSCNSRHFSLGLWSLGPQDGLDWAGGTEQETSPDPCQRNGGKGTALQAPGRQPAGEEMTGEDDHIIQRGLPAACPGHKNGTPGPSALSHSLLAPKEPVISCLALSRPRLLPWSMYPLISPQALFQGRAGQPVADRLGWSSCFLYRKYGFRSQREPSG